MILYHGSNVKVTEIELSKCRPYKNFGKGFYLTDIREQAEQMARRVARLYGGSQCVSAFDFDETALESREIKTLLFENPNKELALFVLNNRNKRFSEVSSLLCNHDNKYDIVFGGLAHPHYPVSYYLLSTKITAVEFK